MQTDETINEGQNLATVDSLSSLTYELNHPSTHHEIGLLKDGVLYKPGEKVTAKDGRKYFVDKNGCWRKLAN